MSYMFSHRGILDGRTGRRGPTGSIGVGGFGGVTGLSACTASSGSTKWFVPDPPSSGSSVPGRAGGAGLSGTGMSISMGASGSSWSASSIGRASSIRISHGRRCWTWSGTSAS
uniref:(northern house mosquito) hypothetical protein n=1 Tax=Culex pipiens TaxID=7175 RepID=A0A8D8A9Y8_CULPI